jgi:oligopeptide transport system substrate-binding protein
MGRSSAGTWSRRAIVALIAPALLALAACGGSSADKGTASAGEALRRSTSDEPRTLDPQFVPGNAGAAVMGDMFEGLLTKDMRGNIVAGLAESDSVSADGRVHTFRLRENIRFSDGRPITAADFVYSFRRSADPRTAARSSRALFPIRNARGIIGRRMPVERLGVSAPDPRTVVIELERPTAYIRDILASFPTAVVPRHAIEAHGQQWTTAANIVTSGAYTLAEWVPNTHIKLRRNPHHYDAANIRIAEIIYYPVERPATALTRYRAGELDIVFNVPVNQIDWIRRTFPNELKSSPVIGLFYVLLNNSRPPMNDVRVRRALSIAIDRDQIANTLMRNEAQPAYSIVPLAMPDYPNNPMPFSRQPIAERQREARALLAEAGYTAQRPLRFAYKFGGQEVNRRLAVALQSMWQAIGAQVELDNVGANSAVADARTGNYQAIRYTYYAPFRDAVGFLRLFETGSNTNFSRHANPAFDRALDEADAVRDSAQRVARLREVETMVMNDYPVAPVYFHIRYYLVSSRVQGFVAHPGGEHLSRYMSFGAAR